MTPAVELPRTGPAGRMAGDATSRPGARAKTWRNRGQRMLTVELVYLISEAPLDLTADERRFLWSLWRHDRRQPWPSDREWSARFGVTGRTVARWRQRLTKAGTIVYSRPWNIPDGRGGWKGPRKTTGVYDLQPPGHWRYLHDWRYTGANGWVDEDGAVVDWPALTGRQ